MLYEERGQSEEYNKVNTTTSNGNTFVLFDSSTLKSLGSITLPLKAMILLCKLTTAFLSPKLEILSVSLNDIPQVIVKRLFSFKTDIADLFCGSTIDIILSGNRLF